ncbi:MAG: phosphodiester glycosidase family protein [Holosporales bacterium]|nr:phosphodiester glycosidase family protein [Holosporales bacterium]
MKRCIRLFSVLGALWGAFFCSADPFYETRAERGHVIHIVTFAPDEYSAHLEKARGGPFGRASLLECAQRFPDTFAAINAGFFEIGEDADGFPSSTLVCGGEIFGIQTCPRSCVKIHEGKISIIPCQWECFLQSGEQRIPILFVNRQPKTQEATLYTRAFGKRTGTAFGGCVEYLFDKDRRFLARVEHGNNEIPEEGYVASLKKGGAPESTKVRLECTLFPGFDPRETASYVAGIPLIVWEGKVTQEVLHSQMSQSFVEEAHARTALGRRPDGTMVVVVAEHRSAHDPKTMTLEDLQTFLRNRGLNPSQLTLVQVRTLLKEADPEHPVVGLSLLQLAGYMISLGCVEAINLDGGKSSALYYEGRLVTGTESRPISDCIIFERPSRVAPS